MFSSFYSKMCSANTSTSISFWNHYPEKQVTLERRQIINAEWHSHQQATKYLLKSCFYKHGTGCAVALYALKAADIFYKTLMKPLLLHPFVHSIYHYSRNLRTVMMENHTERKGTWTLSETRATFLFKRPIMMENHSERQRRNRDPIKG